MSKLYVVSRVPGDKIKSRETLQYCHRKDFPDIPVFGSIGSYKKAKEVCKMMNATITVPCK